MQASSVIERVVRGDPEAASVPSSFDVRFRGPTGSVGPRDVATHWIHWYPAKMFHRIPREIMCSLALPKGSLVLDPFCGSGTVLLEGILRGHQAIGTDVNPLARSISRVKTTPLDCSRLDWLGAAVIRRARGDASSPAPHPVLDFWFREQSRAALHRLKRSIDLVEGEDYREFFLVTLSSIVRRASLADPSIAPPVRMSEQRAKLANNRYRMAFSRAQELTSDAVIALYTERFEANLQRMRQLCSSSGLGAAQVLEDGEAASTGLPDRSVDLVVTSPPYCGSQKYVRSLRLEMLWLGLPTAAIAEADRRTLGTERVRIADACDQLTTPDQAANNLVQEIQRVNQVRARMLADYVKYVYRFVAELARILRLGGSAFVTFGTTHMAGRQVRADEFFCAAATSVGLTVLTTLVDAIPSRGLLTRRHATAGRIDDERVVWVRA